MHARPYEGPTGAGGAGWSDACDINHVHANLVGLGGVDWVSVYYVELYSRIR